MVPLLVGVAGVLLGAAAAHVAEAIMAHRPLERPSCPYCQSPYTPLQWCVLLGWITGQGRCRNCGKGMRWARLAGELFLGLVWGGLVARYNTSPRLFLALLVAVPLSMVLVTDLETRLIPNRIMLPSVAVLLVVSPLIGLAVPGVTTWQWWHGLAGGVVGFLVFWLLGAVGEALVGEGALGAGDVKLAAYIGLAVGFPLIVEALLLTFLLGGVGAGLVLLARRGSLHTAIPYGPFLVLGAAAVMLYGPEIAHWFFG
ncbi:MAG: A24 family peptidase [Anaerolineae bacterium]|nr:A24 family peptidase [Anaerolineae bacterium]